MHCSILEIASPAASSIISIDILTLANRNRHSFAYNSPSFLRGWHFRNILPSDEYPLSIKAISSANGPTITLDLIFINAEYLEYQCAALLWIPLDLIYLCTTIILETDENGLSLKDNWQDSPPNGVRQHENRVGIHPYFSRAPWNN